MTREMVYKVTVEWTDKGPTYTTHLDATGMSHYEVVGILECEAARQRVIMMQSMQTAIDLKEAAHD
jgi:hypothetical protein